MTIQDAIQNITKCCVEFKGTLQEHEYIQLSLNIVKEALKKGAESECPIDEQAALDSVK